MISLLVCKVLVEISLLEVVLEENVELCKNW